MVGDGSAPRIVRIARDGSQSVFLRRQWHVDRQWRWRTRHNGGDPRHPRIWNILALGADLFNEWAEEAMHPNVAQLEQNRVKSQVAFNSLFCKSVIRLDANDDIRNAGSAHTRQGGTAHLEHACPCLACAGAYVHLWAGWTDGKRITLRPVGHGTVFVL